MKHQKSTKESIRLMQPPPQHKEHTDPAHAHHDQNSSTPADVEAAASLSSDSPHSQSDEQRSVARPLIRSSSAFDRGFPSCSAVQEPAAAAVDDRAADDEGDDGRGSQHKRPGLTVLKTLQKYTWHTGESCVFLAALFFALSALCVKLLTRQQQIPAFEIVCASGGLSIILWTCIALAMGQARLYTASCHLPFLLGRGLFGFASTACLYVALEKVELATAVALHYLNPAITSLIAFFLLREKLGWRGVAGVVLSIAGVFTHTQPPILFPSKEEVDWDAKRTAGTIISLASALTGSFTLLSVRYIKLKEPTLSITIWFHLFSFVLSAVLLAAGVPAPPVMPRGVISWVLLPVIGVLLFTASLLIDRSLQLAAAARTSVISLSQLVMTWVFGLLFLNEHTNATAEFGIVLLLIGVSLVAFRSASIEDEVTEPLRRQLLLDRD